MRPETIIVETANGLVMINKSDFDPATHRLPGAESDTALPEGVGAPLDANGLRTDGPTVAEYVAAGYLATNYPPHGYASRSTSEEIAALTMPPATGATGAPPPVLLVTKNDKKRFVVVDIAQKAVTADGIDAEGYKTEKEAWDAINAHIAKLSCATA